MYTAPENRLERMLRLTAEDRSNYKHCLATLLDSTVYFVAPFTGKDNLNLIGPDGKFRINMWRTKEGIKVVPFFSSFHKLKEVDPNSNHILEVAGRVFLIHNQGRGLTLNPGHPHGLNFNSDDTRRMLYFNYKDYLAEVAEEEQQRKKDSNADEQGTATILDFTAAFINRNR